MSTVGNSDASATVTSTASTDDHQSNCNGDNAVTDTNETSNGGDDHPQGDPVVSIQINGDEIAQSPARTLRHSRRHRLDSESIDMQASSDDEDDAAGENDDDNHLETVPTYQSEDAAEVATGRFLKQIFQYTCSLFAHCLYSLRTACFINSHQLALVCRLVRKEWFFVRATQFILSSDNFNGNADCLYQLILCLVELANNFQYTTFF